jgi:hypothetical protein
MDTESLLSAAETGATLVAANTRTQRRLQGLYDARQQQRCGAWPTPAILTWSAWIETLWQEYLLTAAAPPVQRNWRLLMCIHYDRRGANANRRAMTNRGK